MPTAVHRVLGIGLMAVVSMLAAVPPAWSDDDDREGRRRPRREHHRGPERHHDRHEHRHHVREHERHHHRHHGRQHHGRQHHGRGHHVHQHHGHRHHGHPHHVRPHHHHHRREHHWDHHRGAAHWRFERDRGWRWEHRPGAWSPFFVWWIVDGRPLLRPHPVTRVVRYPTGTYELVGDGITTPFTWVWRPTAVVMAPPPVPVPPDLPPGYELPAHAYPPPPSS